MPVSAIVIITQLPRVRQRTVTAPPSGVNFTALDSRLIAICFIARRSAKIGSWRRSRRDGEPYSRRGRSDAQRFRQRLARSSG